MLKSLEASLPTDSDLCVSVVNLDGSDGVSGDGDTTGGGSGATGVKDDSLR